MNLILLKSCKTNRKSIKPKEHIYRSFFVGNMICPLRQNISIAKLFGEASSAMHGWYRLC